MRRIYLLLKTRPEYQGRGAERRDASKRLVVLIEFKKKCIAGKHVTYILLFYYDLSQNATAPTNFSRILGVNQIKVGRLEKTVHDKPSNQPRTKSPARDVLPRSIRLETVKAKWKSIQSYHSFIMAFTFRANPMYFYCVSNPAPFRSKVLLPNVLPGEAISSLTRTHQLKKQAHPPPTPPPQISSQYPTPSSHARTSSRPPSSSPATAPS